jgi:hypothetical protein
MEHTMSRIPQATPIPCQDLQATDADYVRITSSARTLLQKLVQYRQWLALAPASRIRGAWGEVCSAVAVTEQELTRLGLGPDTPSVSGAGTGGDLRPAAVLRLYEWLRQARGSRVATLRIGERGLELNGTIGLHAHWGKPKASGAWQAKDAATLEAELHGLVENLAACASAVPKLSAPLPTVSGQTQPSDKPVWDEHAATLSWRGRVIRQFHKNPAKNQRDIIEAFHNEGWPASIADPWRDTRKLNQTLRDLNASLLPNTIRFAGDATGEGARWEPSE